MIGLKHNAKVKLKARFDNASVYKKLGYFLIEKEVGSNSKGAKLFKAKFSEDQIEILKDNNIDRIEVIFSSDFLEFGTPPFEIFYDLEHVQI